MYLCCPVCGHRLIESEECFSAQVKCSRCTRMVVVTIKENEICVAAKRKQSKEKEGISEGCPNEKNNLQKIKNNTKKPLT